jgi:hypothetical protein
MRVLVALVFMQDAEAPTVTEKSLLCLLMLQDTSYVAMRLVISEKGRCCTVLGMAG